MLRLSKKVSYLHPYDTVVKETIRAAKSGNNNAIITIANSLAEALKGQTVKLVPMPSHTGEATYMMRIAKEVCKRLPHSVVLNALTGKERRSQYRTKKEGGLLKGKDFGFHAVNENLHCVIIDDVIGTGETVKAALEVMPNAVVLAYAADIKLAEKNF